MINSDPNWDLYRSFLGVMRHRSLSAAARVLGLTQPTIGRHINELETLLKVALFTRSPHGLYPTQTARDLAAHAETMESAARAFARAATGEAAAAEGAVRLTASNFIGAEVLPRMLARFREREPHIAIELILSDRVQDLSRRDADIAVRMTRPTQKALVAKRLGKVRIGLYAHRDYLVRHGTPRSVEDLAHHALIGFDRDTSSIRTLTSIYPISRDLFALRCDDSHVQMNALRAGFGIGGCQAGVAARDADLVPVLPGAIEFFLDMWLVMHEDLRATRRVRLLYDHLATELKAYASIRA
jgi:DNA-binding transcriptional LysR family regulator